jgi:hypothetical protein
MKGSLGYVIPKLPPVKSPRMWPKDVIYYNGVCAWKPDGSFAGVHMFNVPVSESIELFPSRYGTGVRANAPIPKGTTIGLYGSEVYNTKSRVGDDRDFDEFNTYVMDSGYISNDAKYFGNETRFINDYRGMAPKENVVMGDCVYIHDWITARPIVTTKRIEAGEELFLDYGQAYWDFFKMRQCAGDCQQLLPLDESFDVVGVGRSRTCRACRGPQSGRKRAASPVGRRIGMLKEMRVDDMTSIPVTVMENGVGAYIDGELRTWKGQGLILVDPRGPEMTKTFSSMDTVEVMGEQTGIWQRATIISPVENTGYNVVFTAAVDGLSKIATVSRQFVRNVHF